MSSIKNIRESVDGRLDRWQARAEAMESQISASKEKAQERVEASKQAYVAAIDKAKAGVEASTSLATEEKQRLHAKLDNARVQAALGKAETKDAFTEQSHKIRTSLKEMEGSIDKEMDSFDASIDEGLEKMAAELVAARNTLDAELEAAEQRLHGMKDEAKEDLQAKAAGVKADIAGFKSKISDRRGRAAEDLDAFNTEFSEGWKKIGAAFKNLK